MIIIIALISGSSFAQKSKDKFNVTGKVTDGKTNLPISGASILMQGNSIGTTSDNDGVFHLIIQNDSAVLQVSFTGYLTQKISVNGHRTVIISLAEDIAQLKDVVIVGYAKQAKQNLVSAVSAVQGDDIVNTIGSSPFGVDGSKPEDAPIIKSYAVLMQAEDVILQYRGNVKMKDI